MRVAYFSPLNPIKSGISDYSEELLSELSGYGRFDLFVDGYRPTTPWLHENFDINDHGVFRERYKGGNDYDISIYHLGNNDNHAYIWRTLHDYPGLVVLHEPILHHFLFSQTIGNGRLDDYLRELDYSYNSMRPSIVSTTLEERNEDSWYNYPLVERVVDSSLGIIVHSRFASEIVKKANPEVPVRIIPSHFAPPHGRQGRSRGEVREALGIGEDEFVLGAFGYMTSSKRIDVLLGLVARIKDAGFRVKLLLVGELMSGCNALQLIEDNGLEGEVLATGFVDVPTFWEYLRVPDACVALRYPSAGETSGSVVKMMGCGCTVALSDYQAFSEFPDDCCVKIPTGEDEADELADKLVFLIENPDECKAIGGRARKHIYQKHNITASARSYIDFIWQILSG